MKAITRYLIFRDDKELEERVKESDKTCLARRVQTMDICYSTEMVCPYRDDKNICYKEAKR